MSNKSISTPSLGIKEITVTKAKVHNLKNISVSIPKNSFVVITGPSGSGKSSLAFDTIYVESQRRYIESLSSYARQFLGIYNPPDVESIIGLSPSIAIDQKSRSKNPRSTVGTVTEIFDYLRILFARVGTIYCPVSGIEIKKHSVNSISKTILSFHEKTKIHILAPIKNISKDNVSEYIKKFLQQGFTKVRFNNEFFEIDESFEKIFIKNYSSETELFIVIDRILIKPGIEKRINDSLEFALKTGEGFVVIFDETKDHLFSELNISPATKQIFPELEPKLFSFNSPLGACRTCNGLGETNVLKKSLLIFDDSLSILDGAIKPLQKKNSFFYQMFQDVAKEEGVDLNQPLKKLPKNFIKILFEGSDKIYKYSFKSQNSQFEFSKPFNGIIKWLEKKYIETESEKARAEIEEYMDIQTCPTCNGLRLNETALATKIANKNIMELCSMQVSELYTLIDQLNLDGEKQIIAEKLIKEIKSRLKFMIDVGLGYLTLNRAAMTLSGGENQRIRLATQIGSALTGILYILDEPSIGLHQRDNSKLISTLHTLKDLGNTVIVVEHDEETISNADYIVDMGPLAGNLGGQITAVGTLKEILNNPNSLTGRHLKGELAIEIPIKRRSIDKFITLKGASQNNVQNVDVSFPLGCLVCLTGVSGSGKSTLLHSILVPALKQTIAKKHKSSSSSLSFDNNNFQSITGTQEIKSVIELGQDPIGRTPHSNPATYTGLFDMIRVLFSETNESKIRGYKQGRFSFNVKGGRCEECEGNGVKKIEMHFLPDVYITCSECNGTRYNKDTLSITYKGKSISDVLDMTIDDACEFFKNHSRMSRILKTLQSVGLGYMKLGQPATTLSGGEAQRLKLSKELSKNTSGHTLYILDEPTTGLHFHDIKILLSALQDLIDKGNSMIIIEHNLDVIKMSDYIVDLGPEGGSGGGNIVAIGTPEEIAQSKSSYTGKYLSKYL